MSSVIEIAGTMERKERPSAVVPMPEATPMQLLAMAMQQGVDFEKLKPLMDLQERWERNQARKAFEAAIASAKPELKPILKNREVDFTTDRGRTNYKYEDFAQIASQVDPILGKYGLTYRHRPKQEGKNLTITCILSHRDGHFEESSLCADNDQSGNKNSIQAVGSTATYLQRYTLKLALGLAASKDDDGRGSDPYPRIDEKQAADLKALITEHGGDMGKLLKYFKISSLADIHANNYEWTVQEIKRLSVAKAEQASRRSQK